jgi:hypothetical protein
MHSEGKRAKPIGRFSLSKTSKKNNPTPAGRHLSIVP